MKPRLIGPALAAAGLAALGLPAAPAFAQDAPAIELEALGTYETGVFAESAAEILAYDPATKRMFVVNAQAGLVDVLDVSDPADPVKVFELDAAAAVGEPGAVVNSVDVHDGVVAVATEAPDKTDDGWVVFFSTDGDALGKTGAGALPDSLTFTPDGAYVLVANEGEPADDYSTDPSGSVSVIDASTGELRIADFSAWDAGERELPAGVRIFGPEGTLDDISANLEPEYVVAGPDSATAYITLQENNAIAVLDVVSAEITDIHPLGFKDHLLPGNELDASDKDDEINRANWPVSGMYLPDTVDLYEAGGDTFLVTANEGDSRDWDAYAEESRVKNLELCADSERFAGFDLAELQADENLGRLKVTTTEGLTEDGCYSDLYSFGGRSFSIWTTDGELVFDSGSEFERILAEDFPADFNSNNDENGFDGRSDDKGPEPEAIAVGAIGERTYAFIGLERQGGIMVYDITDPTGADFVDYVTDRDFTVEPDAGDAGDLGPESIEFIPAADSPTGNPVLGVANEVSGTTTLYGITDNLADEETPGGNDPDPTGGRTDDPSGATGKLPNTGLDSAAMTGIAAVLVAGGATALAMSRRRTSNPNG